MKSFLLEDDAMIDEKSTYFLLIYIIIFMFIPLDCENVFL